MTHISITGAMLQLPDDTIPDCWDDRAQKLLSTRAALALMPFINADTAQERAYDALMATMEDGDPALPPLPEPLHIYTVDGVQAWPVAEVTREQDVLMVDDGLPTGRICMRTVADIEAILGLR